MILSNAKEGDSVIVLQNSSMRTIAIGLSPKTRVKILSNYKDNDSLIVEFCNRRLALDRSICNNILVEVEEENDR